MNRPAAREDKSSGALSSGDYLAACMESHGYRRRVACLATADSESCYDPTNFATLLEDTPPFDAPHRRTTGGAIEINVNTHSAEQKEKEKSDLERKLDRLDSRLDRLESLIVNRPGRYRPPSCECYDWVR
jgi:hypothetical protein